MGQDNVQDRRGNNQPVRQLTLHIEDDLIWCVRQCLHRLSPIGETTARRCVHRLARGSVNCHALAEVYLRKPSNGDAPRVTSMHDHVHKMPGMLGSLDVTKVYWKNCPTALKGQFQGRESVHQLLWNQWRTTIYGFGMCHLGSQKL